MVKKPTFGIERPSATSPQELDAFVKGDVGDVVQQTSKTQQPAPASKKKRRSKSRSKKGGQSKSAVVRADGTEVRRLTVYLPPDLYLKCKVHTAAQDRSLSDWICELVEAELESA